MHPVAIILSIILGLIALVVLSPIIFLVGMSWAFIIISPYQAYLYVGPKTGRIIHKDYNRRDDVYLLNVQIDGHKAADDARVSLEDFKLLQVGDLVTIQEYRGKILKDQTFCYLPPTSTPKPIVPAEDVY